MLCFCSDAIGTAFLDDGTTALNCQGLDMDKCRDGGKPWVGTPVYASARLRLVEGDLASSSPPPPTPPHRPLIGRGDYFQKMYDFAIDLIKHGKAYVDSQTPEEAFAAK